MKRLFSILVFLIFFFVSWQTLIYFFKLPDYILPSPLKIFHTLYSQSHLIFTEMQVTLLETLIGFLLGALLGSIAALVMAYYRPLSSGLLPLLVLTQALPTFAIAPLVVLWFGFGISAKIITTIIMLFFPITSAFLDGLNRNSKPWSDLSRSVSASTWRFFYFIQIPAALPALATGLRVAAVGAPVGAIIGEWVGASKGLGYLILQANARMQIDLMFAGLLVLMFFSLTFYFLIHYFLKKIIWW